MIHKLRLSIVPYCGLYHPIFTYLDGARVASVRLDSLRWLRPVRRGVMDRPRLRRPEYTGSNRCRACTVVNAAVLLVVAALVGLRSPPAAAGVGAVGAAPIALRRYLVPFTPRFAPCPLYTSAAADAQDH